MIKFILLLGFSVSAYAVQSDSVGRIRLDDSTIFLYADQCTSSADMQYMTYVDFAMIVHRGCWKIENSLVHLWDEETHKITHIDKRYIKVN